MPFIEIADGETGEVLGGINIEPSDGTPEGNARVGKTLRQLGIKELPESARASLSLPAGWQPVPARGPLGPLAQRTWENAILSYPAVMQRRKTDPFRKRKPKAKKP